MESTYVKKIRENIPKNIQPRRFIVAAHFDDASGGQKTKTVLTINALFFGMKIDQLIRGRGLEKEIRMSLGKRGILTDAVWSISIRLGCKGSRRYFDWYQDALYERLVSSSDRAR